VGIALLNKQAMKWQWLF